MATTGFGRVATTAFGSVHLLTPREKSDQKVAATLRMPNDGGWLTWSTTLPTSATSPSWHSRREPQSVLGLRRRKSGPSGDARPQLRIPVVGLRVAIWGVGLQISGDVAPGRHHTWEVPGSLPELLECRRSPGRHSHVT